MHGITQTSAPLGANQSYIGPWVDLQGDDLPYITVRVTADQAGQVMVYEARNPTVPNSALPVAGGQVFANVPFDMAVQPRHRFVQVQFVNGATAQTSFVLTANAYGARMMRSDSYTLELMLRELRIMSLKLDQLREPLGSTVNTGNSLDKTQI